LRSRLPALVALTTLACGGVRIPAPATIFPLTTTWTTPLPGERIEGDLATDGVRVFVATREGAVRAIDAATGTLLWKIDGRAGRLSAAPTLLILRSPEGAVERLDPETGFTLWRRDSGVEGVWPATLTDTHALVAGEGLTCLRLADGQTTWTAADARQASAPPAVAVERVLLPETGGTLRCLSMIDGTTLWTHAAGGEILASPTVDGDGRVFVGTMAPSILALDLRKGDRRWRWKRGAGVATPATVLDGRVLVASQESVLFAMKPGGGDIVWRAPLPSRPWSGPLLMGSAVLVACHEAELVGYDGRNGKRLGSLKLPAPFATRPVLLAGRVVLGLRGEAAVVALQVPAPGASPSPSPPSPRP
jgi:outer membrane protein assembly factor BamB